MTEYPSLNIPEMATGDPLEVALERARRAKRINLIGARGGSLAPFLVRLAERHKKNVLVLSQDAIGARALVQDLAYHQRALSQTGSFGEALYFPSYDQSPYDELAPDRRAVMQRTAVLYRLAYGANWRFLVVPASAILRKLIPRRAFEARCVPINAGEEIDREDLVRCLDRSGYQRTPLVEEPGTYAVRGSLLDIFPPYLDLPARVDLFGSYIEKIRLFDPTTQASQDEIDEVWIHPVRLALLPSDVDERRAAAERLRVVCDAVNQPTSQTEQMIDDLLDGRLLVGSEGLGPAFHSSLGRLVDYLPTNLVVCFENPAVVRLTWQKLKSSLSADYDRLNTERVPSFSPESHMTQGEEVASFLDQYPTVLVHSLAVTTSEDDTLVSRSDDVDLKGVPTADLGERLRNLVPAGKVVDLVGPLARYLRELEESGYQTTIVAHTEGQSQRLASMLRGRGLTVERINAEKGLLGPGLSVAVGELSRGCLLPSDGRCWIAEEEIFGRRTRRRAAASRSRSVLGDLRQLTPGDLIVHVEHGIGRYEGLVRRRVRTAEMDFLLITYRGGDKLYLPVFRLNQVQKYKGGEGPQRLDKLGGQTFASTRAEVKRAARDIAGKLLNLYAQRSKATRPPLSPSDDLYRLFEAAFPFEETDDQARAIDEVMDDLNRDRPMDRLVCGDVGFGKTEVAMRAAFRAVMGGGQVAVLVPTTVLAQQHYQTFKERFGQYPVRVEMLSRFRTQSQNREMVLGLKEGTVDIAIGTHRLLSKDVHFRRLGLLVIDEEHRFGVAHKERIRALRTTVDTLVLTATPIPRTLQMAFGGVRDLSLIGTAPHERRAVRTMICHDDPKVLGEALRRELAREGQVFFVHNRVRDIGRVAERVQQMVPDALVAIGHGQMKETELERVMLDFVAGRYNVLVCTSIIESGLDIPRANTIIIDRADTFGMAQLYQLRGRVGRSSLQAYAYLVVPPLSILSEEARQRVETLARYTDLGSGFSVATMDMELRGAGNLLGPEQSGSVTAVGFEMFCDLLSEAASDLRGEELRRDVEPELTFERPGFIPDDYLPDVGQRLQYYKRLASATSEEEVESVAAELVDRYGALPHETEDLIKVMVAKALSRELGIRGVESTSRRLTIHLSTDSRIDPDVVVNIVREDRGRVQLTQDLKVKVLYSKDEPGGVKKAIHFLHRLGAYDIKSSIS